MTSRPDREHRRSLEALYVAHERGLYNVAYRYVWSGDEARDVVHDAFVRLWRKREQIDWPRATGLAYRTVLGLAKNRRRNNAVRRAFLGRWGDSDDESSASADIAPASRADDRMVAAQTDAAVRRCIDELPDRLRSVLVMCTFSELDYAEIGAALGVPAGTVGSRRTEAVARIRAKLEEVHHGRSASWRARCAVAAHARAAAGRAAGAAREARRR